MKGKKRHFDGVGFDLFPRDGLVRKYKPFILKEVKYYARTYYLDYRDVLANAILLACDAEKKHDPAKGSFPTLLSWELKRLNRICQRE